MANLTTTFTSLLSTIETTANSATKLVTSAGRAADMLDRYASEHQHKQALRIAIDRATYEKDLINAAALRLSKEEDKIQTELNNNNQLKQMFAENYKLLTEAVSATKATL